MMRKSGFIVITTDTPAAEAGLVIARKPGAPVSPRHAGASRDGR
jgi:hypothetical protein